MSPVTRAACAAVARAPRAIASSATAETTNERRVEREGGARAEQRR